jgi:hypothetical protein
LNIEIILTFIPFSGFLTIYCTCFDQKILAWKTFLLTVINAEIILKSFIGKELPITHAPLLTEKETAYGYCNYTRYNEEATIRQVIQIETFPYR